MIYESTRGVALSSTPLGLIPYSFVVVSCFQKKGIFKKQGLVKPSACIRICFLLWLNVKIWKISVVSRIWYSCLVPGWMAIHIYVLFRVECLYITLCILFILVLSFFLLNIRTVTIFFVLADSAMLVPQLVFMRQVLYTYLMTVSGYKLPSQHSCVYFIYVKV